MLANEAVDIDGRADSVFDSCFLEKKKKEKTIYYFA
jgi:hypothetical protein